MSQSLLKGFEVEMYTGRADGTVVGCAAEAAAALPEVVIEPDRRNLEYTTEPDASYQGQLRALLLPRQRLRQWLSQRQLTLLPGSTLSLGDSSRFERSDPSNHYHSYIEKNYGTRVVTASIHINLGLKSNAAIFAANRLLRCEGALLLALSASSPFLDGALSGAHSQRWRQFPLTPAQVPLFRDHSHYCRWMEQQLELGTMRNVRHLWCSVRPNGPDRPQQLNRVELRICDLVTDPLQLLAITAYAELRLLQLLEDPHQDPLDASELNLEQLEVLADTNDQAAAQASLNANLHHWRDGRPITARQWLEEQLQQLDDWAADCQARAWLSPLGKLLEQGNSAMRWLARHASGESIASILTNEASAMVNQEQILLARFTPSSPEDLG
jgi:predicted glutamate--cysteine ligase